MTAPTPDGGLPQLRGLVAVAEVDGVSVLSAPREGPVSGGIVFRVGWADEQLARSGITHLVEHLALFGQNLSDVHHNGSTDEYATHFHATGSVDEVVGFLSAVCAALRSLPLDRMEVEKRVLDTEAARRSPHVTERLRLERYGARGSGLRAYEGFGLAAVTPDDVVGWARERFTRENAVCWITTDGAPDGLALELPSGRRWEIPERADVVGRTPAFYFGAPGVVVLDAVVPATTESMMFASVATRALFRALRQEGGLSYDARCEWERLDADHGRLTVFADALAEQQAAVVSEVVDVLSALRAGNVDDSDLAAARSSYDDLRTAPDLGARLLPSTAFLLAAGIEVRNPQHVAEELEQVTAGDLAEVARSLWRGALAQIPEGQLDWAGFTPTPAWSGDAVAGSVHARVGHDHGELIVGAEGVTAREAGGVITVLFAQTEGLEVWPDGARRLIGADGFQILIEPTLHAGVTPEVIAGIDASVPRHLHVGRPARAAEAIPRPPEQGGAAAAR